MGCTGIDPATPTGYRVTRPVDWSLALVWAMTFWVRARRVAHDGGVYHSQRVGGGTTGGISSTIPPAKSHIFSRPCAAAPSTIWETFLWALFSPGSINAVGSQLTHTHNLQLHPRSPARQLVIKTVMEVSMWDARQALRRKTHINQVRWRPLHRCRSQLCYQHLPMAVGEIPLVRSTVMVAFDRCHRR